MGLLAVSAGTFAYVLALQRTVCTRSKLSILPDTYSGGGKVSHQLQSADNICVLMRDLFPGFYPPKLEELDLSIDKTAVIFDANVLLNLYRYPKSASDDLLRLMEALEHKVWLPLPSWRLDTQRNRLTVVVEQES